MARYLTSCASHRNLIFAAVMWEFGYSELDFLKKIINIFTKYVFCILSRFMRVWLWSLLKVQNLTDPFPDPLVRGTDPRNGTERNRNGYVPSVTDPEHCLAGMRTSTGTFINDRDSPAREIQNIAKKRAMERRERERLREQSKPRKKEFSLLPFLPFMLTS